jgi:L,D-transpeptidase catalytic domain
MRRVTAECCRTGFMRTRLVFAAAFACAVAVGASPAAAGKLRPKPLAPATERLSNEPFGKIPKGPLQLIISIDQQKLHLYSDGVEVAETLVATGVPQHPTPTGVFSIIQKSRYHHSNIYSGAPMPFMQRITWSGVALHEGVNLGHPASHGCIRLSRDFATRLWVTTRPGARVIIARQELRPQEIADQHLFVHLDTPAASATAMAKSLKTAQSAVDGKAIDAAGQASNNGETAMAADPPAAGADVDKQSPPARGQDLAAAAPAHSEMSTPKNPDKMTGLIPASLDTDPDAMPPAKPIAILHATKAPISIFVSRKDKKIYVRQDFTPLLQAPVTIEHSEQPLGTHVFTALDYLSDHSNFRWNVISVPGDAPPAPRNAEKVRNAIGANRKDDGAIQPAATPPSPSAAQDALARIQIPQDAVDQISQLIVPGSSLIISDYGLGEETGEGTDFIVVTHERSAPAEIARTEDNRSSRSERYDRAADRSRRGYGYYVYPPPYPVYYYSNW